MQTTSETVKGFASAGEHAPYSANAPCRKAAAASPVRALMPGDLKAWAVSIDGQP